MKCSVCNAPLAHASWHTTEHRDGDGRIYKTIRKKTYHPCPRLGDPAAHPARVRPAVGSRSSPDPAAAAGRFWPKVDMEGGDDDCWRWMARRDRNGYGRFSMRGRQEAAHRAAYVIAVGPIAPGMDVLHRCDNPPCMNPRHLFIGTNRDNIDDKVAKGRQPRGDSSAQAVLTEAQVVEIRRLDDRGLSYTAIARTFPVSEQSIGEICKRQRWKHVA